MNQTPCTLKYVSSFVYLGVTLTYKLSWAVHIHKTCSKACKLIGLIYQHFYTDSSSAILLSLHLSLSCLGSFKLFILLSYRFSSLGPGKMQNILTQGCVETCMVWELLNPVLGSRGHKPRNELNLARAWDVTSCYSSKEKWKLQKLQNRLQLLNSPASQVVGHPAAAFHTQLVFCNHLWPAIMSFQVKDMEDGHFIYCVWEW